MLTRSFLALILTAAFTFEAHAQSFPATAFFIMTGIEPQDLHDLKVEFKETTAGALSKASVEATVTDKTNDDVVLTGIMRQLSDCKFEMISDYASSVVNPVARKTVMTIDFSGLVSSQVQYQVDVRTMKYRVDAEGVQQCLISNTSDEVAWRGLKRGECRTDTGFFEEKEVVAKRKVAALKYLMDKSCKGKAF